MFSVKKYLECKCSHYTVVALISLKPDDKEAYMNQLITIMRLT